MMSYRNLLRVLGVASLSLLCERNAAAWPPQVESYLRRGEYQLAIWWLDSHGAAQDAEKLRGIWWKRVQSAHVSSSSQLPGKSGSRVLNLCDHQGCFRVLFKPSSNIQFSAPTMGSELAMGLVDQILGTRLVPQVRKGRWQGKMGTYHAWVGEQRPPERVKGTDVAVQMEAVRAQHSDTLAFLDKLVDNHDRHLGNFAFVDPQVNGAGQVAFDGGAAFQKKPLGRVGVKSQWPFPSQEVAAHLAGTSAEQWKKLLGGYLLPPRIESFLQRREEALKAFPQFETRQYPMAQGRVLEIRSPARWRVASGLESHPQSEFFLSEPNGAKRFLGSRQGIYEASGLFPQESGETWALTLERLPEENRAFSGERLTVNSQGHIQELIQRAPRQGPRWIDACRGLLGRIVKR